jgi:hypothetical protein
MNNLRAFSSVARTDTPDPVTFVNGEPETHRGVHIIIDVTAVTATPAVTFNIEGYDPISAKWYLLLASAAIATVSTTVLKIYPGLTAAANSVANDVIPEEWRIRPVHADTDSITYSVSVNTLD